MSNIIVDRAKALKKWDKVLESLHVTEPTKREWMAEYAELHSLNENTAYNTLNNMNGMGAVTAAQPSTTPGTVWGNYTLGGAGGIGSGDIGINLLPVSMKIAAQTIGLDLVAVKPAASPKVDLVYVDFRYDNVDDDPSKGQRPLVFKINNVTATATAVALALRNQFNAYTTAIKETRGGISNRMFVVISGLTIGTVATATIINKINTVASTTDEKRGWLEFLGFSSIDGQPMFRIFRQATTPDTAIIGFTSSQNTFAAQSNGQSIAQLLEGTTLLTSNSAGTANTSTVLSGVTLSLVSTMEDHLPGFSANWNLAAPMERTEDENNYSAKIGPQVFTKTVQVGTVEIKSALKRTQIEDIKASTGMDIVQKLESVLVNELTQVISKQIVGKVATLAGQARAAYTTPKDSNGNSKFDFNVDNYLAALSPVPGGETTHSIQRKLIAKINNASNFIATDGRVGPATYLVTNGNLASVIQDVVGYTINPVDSAKLNVGGQLYPLGKIGQISIYVDPYMLWSDNRMFLGRKNNPDQPGLVFLPYLMAQNIQLLSEATFAPTMLIRSRYSVADIGFFPYKQFMEIDVTDSNGILI